MTETESIEYKQSWRDEYLKWICGFANAQGGRLSIGMDDSGLWVEFPYRLEERSGGTREIDGKITGKNNEDIILDLIEADPSISTRILAERVGISRKGIEWHIRQLKEKGRLRRVGPARGGNWEIIGEENDGRRRA